VATKEIPLEYACKVYAGLYHLVPCTPDEHTQEAFDPDAPDGYAIIHYRASGSSTCYFGPFDTLEAAQEWLHENAVGFIVPLYKTVDWGR
jgi:hypothetical protein